MHRNAFSELCPFCERLSESGHCLQLFPLSERHPGHSRSTTFLCCSASPTLGTYCLMVSAQAGRHSLVCGQAIQMNAGTISINLNEQDATPMNRRPNAGCSLMPLARYKIATNHRESHQILAFSGTRPR